MKKAERLRLIAWIVFIGFCVSVVWHYISGFYLGKPYPYNTYLFLANDVWGDFYGMTIMNRNMDPFNNTYAGFGNNYPPFCYLALMPFTELGYRFGSLVFAAIFVTLFFLYAWRFFCRPISPDTGIYVAIVALLAYPQQFALDRLNAENLMVIFVGAFYFLLSGNRKRIWLSGLALGLATAMKIYSGAFLLALAGMRSFKSVVFWTLLSGALATVVAFFALNVTPGEVQLAYLRSAPNFMTFTLSEQSLQHTSSLFAAIRIVQVLLDPSALQDTQLASATFHIYRYFAVALGFALSALCLLGRLEFWERLLLVVVIILLLPPVSFDYKMMYLYLPLAAFLDAPVDKWTGWIFSSLFGWLLIPKGWFILFGHVSVGVLLNISALALLAAMLIWRAFAHKSVGVGNESENSF